MGVWQVLLRRLCRHWLANSRPISSTVATIHDKTTSSGGVVITTSVLGVAVEVMPACVATCHKRGVGACIPYVFIGACAATTTTTATTTTAAVSRRGDSGTGANSGSSSSACTHANASAVC